MFGVKFKFLYGYLVIKIKKQNRFCQTGFA